MLKKSKEVLEQIENRGFEAFIVGGYVRDYYMGKNSIDVDICTNATPKDLSKIFKTAIIPAEKYGSVTLVYNNVRFEITTYRCEEQYDDSRRPSTIKYTNALIEDLKRRDFTINTLCMNSKEEVIDFLNGKFDIDHKIIKVVGNTEQKLQEDVLRILRAVRFATTLNFNLDRQVKKAILKYGEKLKLLSYTRKKEELTRIFTSNNVKYGQKLLCRLRLDKYLEIPNLRKIKLVDDILGIWAQLDVLSIYPFTKTEKETITRVKALLAFNNIDDYHLYKYGLYIVSIVASIKGINKKDIIARYEKLPIKSQNEISITVKDLCTILNKEPGAWLKDLYSEIERKIIKGELINDPQSIENYIINK